MPKASALQKSRAVVGLKPDTLAPKKERKGGDNAHRVSEVSIDVRRNAQALMYQLFETALTQIINQVLTEEAFINAFLHLNDTESTFADHMELESYFRRMAARHAAKQMSTGLMQLVRSMMDLIFGFIDQELKNWTEAACERNPMYVYPHIGHRELLMRRAIVGVLAVTERLAREAEQEGTSIFFTQLFERQLGRHRVALEAFAVGRVGHILGFLLTGQKEQVRTIESAKNINKKRRGVAFFVRHFPVSGIQTGRPGGC
jgi:hypothetical protein